MKVFVLGCACISFMLMTMFLTLSFVWTDIDYQCKQLGLLQIGGHTYDCEPKQSLANESEDFK